MIILLHGENEVEKRNYLASLRNKGGQEVITIDAGFEDSGEIYKSLNTPSLFSEKRLVIVENFTPAGQHLNIGTIHEDVDLILVSPKKLNDSQIKKLSELTKPILFKDEPLIFKFFDNLSPGKTRISLDLFREIKKNTPNELLLWLLVQHLRRLIIVKEKGSKELQDLEQIQNWQAEKYQKLAGYFPASDLKKHYHRLFNLEVLYKHGEIDLSETLAIFIFELTKPRPDSYTLKWNDKHPALDTS